MNPQEPDPLRPDVRDAASVLRQRLGPPPTLEELVAYQAGELPEAEAEKIRDHLALSPSSVQIVLSLDQFWSDEPPADGQALSDADVSADWQTLCRRLHQEGVLDTGDDAAEAPAPPLPANVLPANVVPGHFGPATAPRWLQAAAAILLIACASLFAWNVQLRNEAARFAQQGLWRLELPREGTRSGGEVTEVPAGRSLALNVRQELGAEKVAGFERFRVEVFEFPDGSRVYSQEGPVDPKYRFLIPVGTLTLGGRYHLVIEGFAGGAPTKLREDKIAVVPPRERP